jgi:2-dehydro-3-deoxygluconokinase
MIIVFVNIRFPGRIRWRRCESVAPPEAKECPTMTVGTSEVICLGETMAMVTPDSVAPLATASLFRIEAGGAESNVAIQLQQLGHQTSWVGHLGHDPLGDRVLNAIASQGVDVSWVQRNKGAPTGVYFKDPGLGGTRVHYYRKGSAGSRMSPATLANMPLARASIVHISGITPGLSASCRALVEAVIVAVSDSAALMSFDVNYRAGIWDIPEAAPVLRSLAARSDIVFVGRDEAQTLWGTITPHSIRELLPEPGRLIVKDGDQGATEFGAHTPVFVPARKVKVVEAVGAGDAFASGYLSALLRGQDTASRLDAGHHSAARALASTGDFLPSIHP